jgi:hypothetical protein
LRKLLISASVKKFFARSSTAFWFLILIAFIISLYAGDEGRKRVSLLFGIRRGGIFADAALDDFAILSLARLSCPLRTPSSASTLAKIMTLFVNYPSKKFGFTGNTAPFGGVILGSNPSGVARKGVRLT